jgi:hypothetical protein
MAWRQTLAGGSVNHAAMVERVLEVHALLVHSQVGRQEPHGPLDDNADKDTPLVLMDLDAREPQQARAAPLDMQDTSGSRDSIGVDVMTGLLELGRARDARLNSVAVTRQQRVRGVRSRAAQVDADDIGVLVDVHRPQLQLLTAQAGDVGLNAIAQALKLDLAARDPPPPHHVAGAGAGPNRRHILGDIPRKPDFDERGARPVIADTGSAIVRSSLRAREVVNGVNEPPEPIPRAHVRALGARKRHLPRRPTVAAHTAGAPREIGLVVRKTASSALVRDLRKRFLARPLQRIAGTRTNDVRPGHHDHHERSHRTDRHDKHRSPKHHVTWKLTPRRMVTSRPLRPTTARGNVLLGRLLRHGKAGVLREGVRHTGRKLGCVRCCGASATFERQGRHRTPGYVAVR